MVETTAGAQGAAAGADALARDPAALAALLVPPSGGAIDRSAVRVVRAPGRVNLIGEHTDYNGGLVLPAAIDLHVAIAFAPTDDRHVRLTLARTGATTDIDLDALPERRGSWQDYVAGTAWALREAGATLHGFRGLLASDVPSGAGLSSSAALELAVAFALGAGGRPPIDDRMTLARVARRAENAFVGVPSGLMDQFAVAFGVEDAALLLDCRSLEHEVVPLPAGLQIAVTDSRVRRGLRESGYAERRAACERAVEEIRRIEPEIESLRDVDEPLLERARDAVDPVAWRRARHVVTENARVREMVAALGSGNLATIGAVMAVGHASLRDDFEVSTPELDHLVEIAVTTPGVVGSRLTGAGFGGSTVTLGPHDALDDYAERVSRGYRAPDGSRATVRRVRAAAGVGFA